MADHNADSYSSVHDTLLKVESKCPSEEIEFLDKRPILISKLIFNIQEVIVLT